MIWHARVSLICFYIVEWYFPDRVIRQFGDHQLIPDQCDTSKALHRIDLRGKNMNNWREIHRQYVEIWEDRLNNVMPLVWESRKKYSKWYASHSRQYISHTGSMLGKMLKNFRKIKLQSDQPELVSLAEE
ncbi:hypothetical protein MLD38_018370 [Melastoma candidum]|uniref:Uncharacterized protein n=1 Tax=Melastoma candidum TaxID=119954 RepID=A0ACB9R1W0_9MYRT|nr:hypothetical protein MLD38_018370 [Melastoma candidum]